MSSNGFPQGESIAPRVLPPRQCPGCPLGNSLPIIAGEDSCALHVWWASDNNGAASNIIWED